MKKTFYHNWCACALLLFGLVQAEGKTETDSLIAKAKFSSGNQYNIVPNGFIKGAKLWTDRKYTVEELPDELLGGTLIQTPMEDRSVREDSLISFHAEEDCVVYVGIKEGRKPPAWLSGWEETTLTVEASNRLIFYRKPFPAKGKVVLGNGRGLQAMYPVVVVKNNRWVDLLEGDSLELWEPGPSKAKSKSGEIGNRWSLKDGVLHLDRDAEEGRGGQIWTKKNYYDFELKFEFNIAYDGNSGIKYRAADVDGSALGCEYQIIDDDNYRDNKNPTHRTACLYELVAVPADRKWNPAGEWNTGRIRVSDNQFEHWLNGEKVVSIEFGSDDWKERFAKSKYKVHPDFAKDAGPIVLTDHQDTVSYRNIQIRDLGAKPEPIAKPVAAADETMPEPLAYTTNCKACHLLDQMLVGPALVELAELYPRDNLEDFIQWTINPGRKRDHLPQMPSMAHLPREQVVEIYEYIRKVTVGVTRVKTGKADPFATAPAKTKRPRIERTFVPEAGPASLILALPTSQMYNVVWDTDRCRLRYITVGEPDNYPYLRSNGNSFADVGEIIYREADPIFKTDEIQFQGYHLSAEGYPSFVYRVGETEITETISVKEDAVVREISTKSNLPGYATPGGESDQLKVDVAESENAISVTYSAK